MPHYLIAGYLPTDFDPSAQDEAMVEEIHELNREMVAAGVRGFAGGLGAAHTLRASSDGDVHVTDGPYLETKELVGGITILEPPMWTRRSHGRAGPSRRAECRSRCGRFSSCRRPPRTEHHAE